MHRPKARHLLTIALALMIAVMWGCGTSNNTTLSTADEVTLSEADEMDSSLFAAPKKAKKDKKDKDKDKDDPEPAPEPTPEPDPEPEPQEPAEVVSYYAEGWIGTQGGSVEIKKVYKKDKTKLKFLPHALSEDTLVTMLIETDHDSFVEFTFGPHTPYFGAEVQLDLSWAYLPLGDEENLTLYYWNGTDWQPELEGQWCGGKKVKLYPTHFSRYYFERR